MREKTFEIAQFILEQTPTHPKGIVSLVAKKFNMSLPSAWAHVAKEVKKGTLIKTGNTKSTRYYTVAGKHIAFTLKRTNTLLEDKIWSQYVKPLLQNNCPENILRIANYGFTEMYNNAIDHSEGTEIYTDIRITDNTLEMLIADNGVGIFNKIKKALNLESTRESILHLSKGKFTTDPTKHTGLGIFFTSRMFDHFSIFSSNFYYSFENEDFAITQEKHKKETPGTLVTMNISLTSTKTTTHVNNMYYDQEIGFTKTTVAVALSSDPDDPHVSRSQAKRLLIGLERFKTVVLNFKDVHVVGQAFIDEIFRVFQAEHPDITLLYINANTDVQSMIQKCVPNHPQHN